MQQQEASKKIFDRESSGSIFAIAELLVRLNISIFPLMLPKVCIRLGMVCLINCGTYVCSPVRLLKSSSSAYMMNKDAVSLAQPSSFKKT